MLSSLCQTLQGQNWVTERKDLHFFVTKPTQKVLLKSCALQCLLMASMPHPTADLSYSTYCVEMDLIPGIDLFSEPDRGNLGTTVACLSFLCHWLYTSGHLLKVLEPHSLKLMHFTFDVWSLSLYSKSVILLISVSPCAGSVPVYCQNRVSGSTSYCQMQNRKGLKDFVVSFCCSWMYWRSLLQWMYLSILWVLIRCFCVFTDKGIDRIRGLLSSS